MAEEKIRTLLEDVRDQELALPEFQREFTWDRDQTKELMKSLFNEYPTGSLLVWNLSVEDVKVNQKLKFKNDAADLEHVKSIDVLLDGQQRLTTLYMYCFGEVPPFYNENEIEENVWDLYFNIETAEFEYFKKNKMANNPLWVSVVECFNEKPNLYEIVEVLDIDDEDKHEFHKKLDENVSKLRDIPKRNYPIQKVPSNCGLGEAVEVFDLINSQGTPLSKADIALAHMTESWPEVRRKFKAKKEELEDKNFEFDLTFMTRCINGIVTGHAEFEKIHAVGEEELKEGWEKLTDALDYLISLLRHKGYIYTTDDLNTTNVLVPLVVYISKEKPVGSEIDKLLYWMYGALFKRRYSSQTDQLLEDDISSLIDELKPEVLINNLKEDEGEPEVTPQALDMRGVGHPFYDMMCIVARSKGAVDWSNGLPLRETIGDNYKIQRHHIFPRSVLTNNGYDTGESQHDKKRVNEIANRVPLTKSGNLDIFNDAPEEYLPKVQEKNPGALEKLFVPQNKSLWKVENYEEFLDKRRELIVGEINKFMNSLLTEQGASEFSTKELIKEEEGERLEFKSSLRYDFRREQVNKELEKAVAKTVSGFMNSNGGILLIGVNDNGEVEGLQKDYNTLRKSNRDGFELQLTQVLEKYIGKGNLHKFSTTFEEVNGKDVCKIVVDSSSKPVYLEAEDEDEFYVRQGNSTRPYTMSEAQEYIDDNM